MISEIGIIRNEHALRIFSPDLSVIRSITEIKWISVVVAVKFCIQVSPLFVV